LNILRRIPEAHTHAALFAALDQAAWRSGSAAERLTGISVGIASSADSDKFLA